MDTNQWISVREASRRLGISVQMVRNYCRRGDLDWQQIVGLRGWLVRADSVAGLVRQPVGRPKTK